MSAAVVGVLLDLYDGTGTPISQGVAQLTPTAQLTDRTTGMLITESPVRVEFRGGLPIVDLMPNDAPGLVPAGSAWRVSFMDVPGNPAGQTVQIPAGPAAFIVAAGNPAVFTWTPPNAMLEASGVPNGTGIILAGILPAAFSSGTTYWVVASSGPTFRLARTPGGAPIATDGTGSGFFTVTQWRLSSLIAGREPADIAGREPADIAGRDRAETTAMAGRPAAMGRLGGRPAGITVLARQDGAGRQPASKAGAAGVQASAAAQAPAGARVSAATTATARPKDAGAYGSVVNVIEFGATGDGTTDDTAAVQAAIDYASETEAVTFFPAGMFRVSQLVLPTGAILQGTSSGTYPDNNEIPGVSVLARLANTNRDLLLIPETSSYQRIFDIAIDGNKNNNDSGYGICVADATSAAEAQVIIQRCYVHDNPSSNIYLGARRRANKILDSVCNYSEKGDGITVAGSDNTIEHNICGSNARAGICLGTTATQHWDSWSNGNACAVAHVDGNDLYHNQVGIVLANGASDCMIMNNGIDRSDYEGITVYSGASNTISGNAFHSNGIDSHNSYAHIDVASGVTAVVIDDNAFGPQDGDCVDTVASFCVTVSGNASSVVGNIGAVDPTSSAGGPMNIAANSAPWTVASSTGAVIKGSGNDILHLRNASGSLVAKVTNGGSFVHTGGGAQFVPNSGHVFGSTSPIGSSNLVSLVGSNPANTQLAIANAESQSAPIAAFYDSDGSTVLAQIDARGGYTVLGLAGATAGARFAGGTLSGAPASGTFSAGDFVVDQTGLIWVCTAGGSPGTWVSNGNGDNGDNGSTGSGGPTTMGNGNWTPADQGLIAWTQDPAQTAANSQLPAAGTLYLCRVHVPSDARVTNILTAVTSSSSTLTTGQCFAALYASYGSLIAATDDQSTVWATSGLKTMPLSGGPVDIVAGEYYIGIYANGTALPNFARGNNQIAGMVNAGLSSGFRFAAGATKLAGEPPSSAGDLSVSAFAWWLALS